MNILVSLIFVASHGERMGRGVVDTLDTVVCAPVIGTDGNIVDAEAVEEGKRTFGANLESVVG